MTHQVEEIPVSSIVLNPKNYRHDEVTSQEECFAALFGDDKDRTYMLNLAADIAAKGLDPSSLPIVEPVDSHWRVLEGNRRIAALKVMANPSLLTSLPGLDDRALRAYRDEFAALGSVSALPRDLLCVVTSDTDRADHWVTMKHTGVGQHKGAGTVPWDTVGRTRHEMALAARNGGRGGTGASSEQSGRAVLLLDALRAEFDGDDEVIALVDGARAGGVTTLGRLLGRPENRLRLGVQIDEGEVTFVVTRPALRAAIVKVLSDLGTPALNSRTANTAANITDYLNRVSPALPSGQDRQDPRAPGTTSPEPAGDDGEAEAGTARRRRAPAPARKPYGGLTLSHASSKTRAVLAEMKKLTFKAHPNTCVILNRVLLDLYTQDVLDALGKKPNDSSAKNFLTCLKLVDPQQGVSAQKRRFPELWDATDRNLGILSIDSMHMYLHRTSTHQATEDIPRKQCGLLEPFLRALDDYVETELSKTSA